VTFYDLSQVCMFGHTEAETSCLQTRDKVFL